MSSSKLGVLYIVSTPIGNLSDISLRALEVLKQVAFIAAEDTRHSRVLLNHYSISTPLFSLHEHNESSRIVRVKELLSEGRDVALVSDAGTPLISDPGFKLVSSLREDGFTIVPVPGACAAIASLSVSGFATDRFYFEGFLPRKTGSRRARLAELCHFEVTVILYESPNRLSDCLIDLKDLLGDSRRICLARELTKTFESVLLGTPTELIDYFKDFPEQLKGECILLIEAMQPEKGEKSLEPKVIKLLQELSNHLPPKVAVSLISEHFDLPKKKLYDFLIAKKS